MSFLFGLKGMAIAIVISAVVAFGGGWKVRDAFCDAAKASADLKSAQNRVKALEDNIRVMREAANADASRAKQDQNRLAQLEKVRRELEAQISDGECLSAADVDRLRRIFE